jgi:hypothetical protein
MIGIVIFGRLIEKNLYPDPLWKANFQKSNSHQWKRTFGRIPSNIGTGTYLNQRWEAASFFLVEPEPVYIALYQ